ncbi:uncharacterized protein LOC135336958 isoform X2 [Halichondria panicea]|uniref:uncharacterized protein LOC135336958 isoform X2 n=1 Tax=Halichondria panicea TaxID=6063 RepID=UPI00312B670E
MIASDNSRGPLRILGRFTSTSVLYLLWLDVLNLMHRPRRWPEASMLSDGESATVPNPQLGQLRETFTPFISDTELQETFTPFISDTEQQEGGLTTPVDPPLTGQNFWDLVWEIQAKLKAREFQAKLKAREIQAKLKAREFQAKLKAREIQAKLALYRWKGLDRWKALNRLKALKTLHAMQTSDMLKALDALEASDLLDALDMLEALEEIEAKLERREGARLERMEELKIFLFRLMRTANFKKAMAFLPFSMNELVSLLKSMRSGWGPPLEMAARMLNSKFWAMEADVWADLLIVCCWANPTIYCEKCDKDVESTTTSCNHVVCPVCAVGQGNDPSCPECGEIFTVLVFTSALASAQEKPIRKRRLCEPPTTTTKRPCTDSASMGSCSNECQSKYLSKLLEYLHPAMNKWYYIGLTLGVPTHILEAIEAKRSDKLDCLREMLITRLNMKEELSKEELIQSLQVPIVGFSKLAQTLEDSKHW